MNSESVVMKRKQRYLDEGSDISSTFHFLYLLLYRRLVQFLISVVLKMAENLQKRLEFYISNRGAKN